MGKDKLRLLSVPLMGSAEKNRKFHRGLEGEYLRQLMTRGRLSFLRNSNLLGDNIDIQIRNNYINLYYKGASLIRFEWKNKSNHEIKISEAYFKPVPPKDMGVCPVFSKDKEGKGRSRVFKYDVESIKRLKQNFKDIISQLKKNIDYLGRGKENAFEQLFIENNLNQKK